MRRAPRGAPGALAVPHPAPAEWDGPAGEDETVPPGTWPLRAGVADTERFVRRCRRDDRDDRDDGDTADAAGFPLPLPSRSRGRPPSLHVHCGGRRHGPCEGW
ncbi:hypothetical protein [Streptomyces sp. NPDC059459]|uniref:hypothetical protein n=1 Tax=unclassified Streptomyces TaxID=2593676 RepID=UPI0036A8B5E6